MSLPAVIAMVLATAVVAASTGLAYYGLVRGFRDEWRRLPADRRRGGVVIGALVAVAEIAAVVLIVAAPWGGRTVVYVIAIYAGLCAAAMLVALAAQVLRTRMGGRDGVR
jgi:hypothetical protein